VALAPVRQGGRPLPGAAKIVCLLAGEDDAAVDDPRGNWRELASQHRDHRQVEEREALSEPSEPDQGAAMRERPEREEIGIPETLSDRGGLGGRGSGGLQLAVRLLLQGPRDEEVAALYAVGPLAIQQPLRAGEPAAGPPELTARGEAEADPEGTADRRQSVLGLEVQSIGALHGLPVVLLAPEHVGRDCEQLQVPGIERS
jgi:hypothetical protein